MIISAGLAILHDNKILLVHPTNAPWYGSYSIPKGEVNAEENIVDAAFRETEEEIGIRFNKKNLMNVSPNPIHYQSKSKKSYKKVYYFIIQLSESLDLSKCKLQLEEVDWVGFFDKDEAEKRILPKLKDILKYLK